MVITHLWLKIVTLKDWNIFGFLKVPFTSYTSNSHTVWVVHVIRKPIISSSKGVDQILWAFKLPVFRLAADVLSALLIDYVSNFWLHFMIILMFMNQNWIGDHKVQPLYPPEAEYVIKRWICTKLKLKILEIQKPQRDLLVF